MHIKNKNIDDFDWPGITAQLDREGYALLPGLLDGDEAGATADLSAWREAFYPRLAPIANRWNEAMEVISRYPAALDEFHQRNPLASQGGAPPRLSRLYEGDYQALHQTGEGEHVFPLQLVALLSEPGMDFSGGEFVMTEQRPRMQSRPMVLPLRRGDAAIITVAHRPVKGSKGYYTVNLKHAISRVRSGERIGLEMLFRDGA